MFQQDSVSCTIKERNAGFKRLFCQHQLLFLLQAFSLHLTGDATQDDLQDDFFSVLYKRAHTFSWSCDETWLWPGLKPPPDGGTEGIPGPWKTKPVVLLKSHHQMLHFKQNSVHVICGCGRTSIRTCFLFSSEIKNILRRGKVPST